MSGFPYSRLMAATMLASLVSALFALPARAAAVGLTVTTTSSVPAILPNGTIQYTVVIDNPSLTDATNVTLTDTLSNASTAAAFNGTVTVDADGTTWTVTDSCAAPSGTSAVCNLGTLAAGTNTTIVLSVSAGASVGTVTNDANVTDTEGDDVDANPSATTLVQDANVQVTKTHAPTSVNPGGAFTYTVLVKNNGPSIATGVQLTDSAPAGVTFGTSGTVASSDSATYTCTFAASQVTCSLGTIAVNTTVTITINATLALSAAGQITNTATETATSLDSVPGNNSGTDSLTPAQADLGVLLSVNPTSVAPGGTVTYTVSLQGDPAVDATNVTVTDTLPAGLTAVTPPTAATPGTATVTNNVWTWTIPTVTKGTTITASFDATVDAGTPVPSTITDTVSITKADQTDPVTTNNTASVDLAVTQGIADLTVTSGVDNSKPSKGDTIAIGILVANAGPDDATNVVLKDVLPNGLKFKSCTGCSRKAWTGLFTLAPIPAGSAATVTLNVSVQASSGTLKNTASVQSADQSDPNGADDKDSLTITVGGSSNNSGGGGGSGSGSGGSGSGTSGSGGTAFTGFTAAQLMPWFMLLFSVGLAAVELSRRRALVSPIGYTYGFDRPF